VFGPGKFGGLCEALVVRGGGAFVGEKVHGDLGPLVGVAYGGVDGGGTAYLSQDGDIACENGRGAGECFDNGEAETFGFGGLEDEGGVAVGVGDFVAGEAFELGDGTGEVEAGDKVLLRGGPGAADLE